MFNVIVQLTTSAKVVMSFLATNDIKAHANIALPSCRVDADTPGVHRRRQGVDNSCVGVAVPSKYLKQLIKYYRKGIHVNIQI